MDIGYSQTRTNLPSIGDFQKAQDEFEMKKRLQQAEIQNAQMGGQDPAPLKLANEYQARLAAGDVQGANLIMQFAKTQDRGLSIDANGNYVALPNYANALGGIEATREGMKQNAKNYSDINSIIPKENAKAQAENFISGSNLEGQLPNLQKVASDLSTLGQTATYTNVGKGLDFIRAQTGGYGGLVDPGSEGAIARTKYISKVDNEVLPLLRQTFGAQFTQKEGESLKATLGDPDKTPQEKDAVLKSFIEQKIAQIQTYDNQNMALSGQNVPMLTEADLQDPLVASRNAIMQQNKVMPPNPYQTIPQGDVMTRAQTEFENKKKPRLKYNPATGEFE